MLNLIGVINHKYKRGQEKFKFKKSFTLGHDEKKFHQILLECESELKRKGDNFRLIFPFPHANISPGICK